MKKLKIILIFVIFLGVSLIAHGTQYYRVNDNMSQIINEYNKRYIVENISGDDIFIPTNSSIEWQFFIDNKPAKVSLYTSSWTTGNWGSCDKICGPGIKTRTAICKRSDGVVLGDSFCSGIMKPTISESCNNGACVQSGCSKGQYGYAPYSDWPLKSFQPSIGFYAFELYTYIYEGQSIILSTYLSPCPIWGYNGCSSKTSSGYGFIRADFICKNGKLNFLNSAPLFDATE